MAEDNRDRPVVQDQRRSTAPHEPGIHDGSAGERVDRLMRLVGRHFDVPIALISPVDEHGDESLLADFPAIRFHAAEPLRAATGETLGFLCLLDHQPRTLSDDQQADFSDFARLVEQELAATGAQRAAQADISQLQHKIGALETDLSLKAADARVSIRQNARLLVEREAQKRRADASDALQTLILDSAQEGIFGIDLDGNITFINLAACRLTGYQPQALIGRNMHRTIHHAYPDGSPYLEENCPLSTTLRTGEGYFVDNEVFWRHDGTSFRVAYSTTAMLDGQRVVGAVCTFQDVSEQRRGNERLAASEATMAGVLSSSRAGIFTARAVRDAAGEVADFEYELANSAAAAMTGRPLAAIIGARMHALVPGARATGLYDRYVAVVETGEPLDLDLHYDQDGLDLWTNISAVRLEDGIAVTVTDITARKQVEAALRLTHDELQRQHDLLGLIIEASPNFMAFLDTEFRYRVVNRAMLQGVERTRDEVLGRRAPDLFPMTWAVVGEPMRHVIETGEPFQATDLEIPFMRGGRVVETFWDVNYNPLRGADGAIIGLVAIAQEVTARVRAQRLEAEKRQLVEQASRHKDEFLSILSHELRTPLNAVLGFGTILEDGIVGDLTPDQAEFVGKILQSGSRMLDLVDTLLDMSRVQAGQFSVDLAPTAIAPVIRSALSLLEPSAAARGQRLVNEVGADLPPVMANAERVGQIIDNLVSNAVKYTPQGSAIIVRAVRAGDRLRVEVADNGAGIADADRERVFAQFTQLDMSNTRARGGVGLGLSIVKALVEAHGGAVGVESAPDQGATFWFTLPLAPS